MVLYPPVYKVDREEDIDFTVTRHMRAYTHIHMYPVYGISYTLAHTRASLSYKVDREEDIDFTRKHKATQHKET